MKTNIVLIGFMGAGKTVVGKALAAKLNKEFVELDELIVQRAGKPITQIFTDDGEIAFRELEITVTRDVSAKQGQVIATGGGIILNRINIDRLKQNGIIVYLTVTPLEILKRVAGDRGRPLLNVPDKERQIKELLDRRRPLYEQAADVKINTTKKGIEAIVEEVAEEVKRLPN